MIFYHFQSSICQSQYIANIFILWDNDTDCTYTFYKNMWFEINTSNEFVEKTEGPIKIDGMLSQEEIAEFSDAFESDRTEIRDETDWKLAEFLHWDVLPHLEISNLDPALQEKIIDLAKKHPDSNILDLWVVIPAGLENQLLQWGLDLSIQSALWDIEAYISENLRLPADSNISASDYAAILQTTGRLIQDWVWEIEQIIAETKLENPDLSSRELTWIINSKISSAFNDIRDHVIPTLQIYLKYSSQGESEQQDIQMREVAEKAYVSQRHPDPDAAVNRTIDQMVERKYKSLQKDTQYFERIMKDSFIQWNIDRPGELRNIDTSMWLVSSEFYSNKETIQQDLKISLLNEADQAIESKAMLYYLFAVWVQCLPYIWAAPWLAADGTDVFSSGDATMMWLKNMWLVPQEYNLEKTLLDSALAWAGLVLTVVWLQWIAKSWKLAKAFKWIKHLSASVISESLSLFSSKMWLWEKSAAALRKLAGIEETLPVLESIGPTKIMKHATPEKYIAIGWAQWELGFVGPDGIFHANMPELLKIPQERRFWELKAFISHERAHQKFMSLPPKQIQSITHNFEEAWMLKPAFLEKYNISLKSWESSEKMDIANEVVATMIERLRRGKDTPEKFMQILSISLWKKPEEITQLFGVQSVRKTLINWDVTNASGLRAAARVNNKYTKEALNPKVFLEEFKTLFTGEIWDGFDSFIQMMQELSWWDIIRLWARDLDLEVNTTQLEAVIKRLTDKKYISKADGDVIKSTFTHDEGESDLINWGLKTILEVLKKKEAAKIAPEAIKAELGELSISDPFWDWGNFLKEISAIELDSIGKWTEMLVTPGLSYVIKSVLDMDMPVGEILHWKRAKRVISEIQQRITEGKWNDILRKAYQSHIDNSFINLELEDFTTYNPQQVWNILTHLKREITNISFPDWVNNVNIPWGKSINVFIKAMNESHYPWIVHPKLFDEGWKLLKTEQKNILDRLESMIKKSSEGI